MADVRLTLADQAFINAMIVVCAPSLGERARQDMAFEAMLEVLPAVNRGNHQLKPLIHAAEEMAAGRRNSAHLRAHLSLADVAMWRLGLALEAFRDKQGSPTT